MDWTILTIRVNTALSVLTMIIAAYFYWRSEKRILESYPRFLFQQYLAFIGFFFLLIARDILVSLPWLKYKDLIVCMFSFAYLPLSFSIFKMIAMSNSENSIWQALYKIEEDKNEKETFSSIYDSIFFRSSIGFSVVDTEGNVLDINPAFAQMLGYSRQQLIGRKFAHFTYQEDKDRTYLRFQKMLKHQEDSYVIEKRYLSQQEEIVWVRLSVVHYYDNRVKTSRIIALAENITPRKKAEAEQRQHLQDLETIQHATSHQIRSPLGSIAKKMNRLHRHGLRMKRSEIQDIALESKELAIQIGDLLDSLPREFRSTQQHNESCLLIDSISITLKRLSGIIQDTKARVYVEELCEDPGKLQIDLMTLANILQILIENAIKYCSENKNPLVQIHCSLSSNFFEIRIIDNGTGIPPEKWESIFQGGVRLTPKIQGSGIGLSLARRLISNFGGYLTVEFSDGNSGSVFLLKIPKAKEMVHEFTSSLARRR